MAWEASDLDTVATARKYRVQPGSLKCEVFQLLDAGYSPAEIRFLLRDRPILAATVTAYYKQWRARQGAPAGC